MFLYNIYTYQQEIKIFIFTHLKLGQMYISIYTFIYTLLIIIYLEFKKFTKELQSFLLSILDKKIDKL